MSAAVPRGRVRSGHLDERRPARQASSRQPVGVPVRLRDSATLDDLGEATAPVEPGDLVATVERVYRVEVVLAVSPEARCVPALAVAVMDRR